MKSNLWWIIYFPSIQRIQLLSLRLFCLLNMVRVLRYCRLQIKGRCIFNQSILIVSNEEAASHIDKRTDTIWKRNIYSLSKKYPCVVTLYNLHLRPMECIISIKSGLETFDICASLVEHLIYFLWVSVLQK